jgi:hypothetical protein
MNRLLSAGFAVAALIAPAIAHAQGGAVVATPTGMARGGQGGGGARGGFVAGAVETKITTGRPYAADAVTETNQVLADGTRISRSSATKVYRDGEGRTRREMLNDDGSVRTIAISDPVAHVNYSLDPKSKAAFKTTVNIVAPTVTMVTRERATATVEAERQGTIAARGGGGRGGTLMRTPAPDNPNVKKEDLGSQNIEGVMANGTRTTTTIPPGEIGNDKEIRIVSEQWFSDELQALVMTRHSDPRSGETIYRLRNILRAEPDQTLFTVPSDYTVQQRGIRQ